MDCLHIGGENSAPSSLLDHIRPPQRDEEPPRKRRKTEQTAPGIEVDEADAVLLASHDIELVSCPTSGDGTTGLIGKM